MPHVEPATRNDLPAIRTLLAAAALPVDDVDGALLDGLLVIRGSDGLQGVVGLQHTGDATLLRSLAVAVEARSLGLGRALVEAAEAQAHAAGIGTLYLLTTSAADYFQTHGYRHCDRGNAPDAIRAMAQFSALCPASSAFMAKPLAATIWHNPACGTSRNTLALLRHAGIEPDVIEYLQTPPSRDALLAMIARAGLTVRDAIRQKGTPYFELGLDDEGLSDQQLLDAMLREPILINRPFVDTGLGARLCRPSELVLDILPPVTQPFTKEDGEVVIDMDGHRVR